MRGWKQRLSRLYFQNLAPQVTKSRAFHKNVWSGGPQMLLKYPIYFPSFSGGIFFVLFSGLSTPEQALSQPEYLS